MEFKVDRPIFRQIADLCHERIISGQWVEGERVPSVRELSLELSVNAHTVLKAYDVLQKEGVIESRRGLGFFLSADAREQVRNARREEFLNSDLPEFMTKAASLGIPLEEVINRLHTHQSPPRYPSI